ncbi:hypothetical protein LJ739_13830 [Aestuariibacter halophilus]|uniref:Uncharacterized protein n=1 Tax=Fluctibacter halophilus TaxID=226011 RepID=A0ABS8GA87_9ALTE|nr:hypothetical protein [Aestuariibacter halophilus]MCC2617328.1 hypothetical protein [Aestuariibacter halophilus]
MKKVMLPTAMLALGLTLSVQASVQDNNIKYVGDTHYAGFCKAVVTDNVVLFKRAINRFVGTLGGSQKDVLQRVLENNSVTCAGEGLKDFSNQRNAMQVAAFIEKAGA